MPDNPLQKTDLSLSAPAFLRTESAARCRAPLAERKRPRNRLRFRRGGPAMDRRRDRSRRPDVRSEARGAGSCGGGGPEPYTRLRARRPSFPARRRREGAIRTPPRRGKTSFLLRPLTESSDLAPALPAVRREEQRALRPEVPCAFGRPHRTRNRMKNAPPSEQFSASRKQIANLRSDSRSGNTRRRARAAARFSPLAPLPRHRFRPILPRYPFSDTPKLRAASVSSAILRAPRRHIACGPNRRPCRKRRLTVKNRPDKTARTPQASSAGRGAIRKEGVSGTIPRGTPLFSYPYSCSVRTG